MDRAAPSDRRDRRMLVGLFATGLALAGLMIARVGVNGDALDLLARGWLLAEKGVLAPLGNSASGGGYVPGGLTALLVGFPLSLWMDHRAPILLILLCHVVAYLILDRLVSETLGPRARLIFAVLYWLNPWRLYQSAWLDNSNYVFLTGAIHAWACWRQRERPSLLHSALMVAAVGLTVQLHLNAVLLVFAAILLWLRGYWKPHWGGIALGSLVTFGALVPFFLELRQEPTLLPGSRDAVNLSLLLVQPVLKGMTYWFRYASLSCSSQSMLVFDFTPTFGARANGLLAPFFSGLGALGYLTLVAPFVANAWCWRRFKAQPVQSGVASSSARGWLRGYAVWTFVSCVIANAISPAPAMWWHNLIALHAAILPVLLWVDLLGRTRRAARVRQGLAAWGTSSVLLLVGMAFGSEQYGRTIPVPYATDAPADHEMTRQMGLSYYRGGRWPRKDDYFYRVYMAPYELSPADGGSGR